MKRNKLQMIRNLNLINAILLSFQVNPTSGFQDFWQAIDEQNIEEVKRTFKAHFWNLPGPGKSGIFGQFVLNIDEINPIAPQKSCPNC